MMHANHTIVHERRFKISQKVIISHWQAKQPAPVPVKTGLPLISSLWCELDGKPFMISGGSNSHHSSKSNICLRAVPFCFVTKI